MEVIFLLFVIFIWLCICAIKRSQRNQDESDAHNDLPQFRETMSERRARVQRGEQPSAPSQDPELDRDSQIKSVLFSRKLGANESVSSLRSVLSATKEEYNDATMRGAGGGGGSKRGDNFISRSWKAASHSVRTLSREECSICLDNYAKDDTVCWSKTEQCDHIFHEDCISTWLGDHDECPLCRNNLFEGVEEDDKKEESERNDSTEERNANEENETNNTTEERNANEENEPNDTTEERTANEQ